MMKKLFGVFLIATALIAMGCSSKTTPTSASSIGVPECDEYIQKYQTCISSKVPESAQGAIKSAFDQSIQTWKQQAATPSGKSALAMACKMAKDSSKQAMGVYGCEF